MTETDTVTIPRGEYEAMRARLEDLDDILAGHAAKTGAVLPHDFAMRIIGGEHPVRVWRDYRGFSAATLADAAKVSKAYLSEMVIIRQNSGQPSSRSRISMVSPLGWSGIGVSTISLSKH